MSGCECKPGRSVSAIARNRKHRAQPSRVKEIPMKRTFFAAACCLILLVAAVSPLSAQLAAPTSAGVSLGAVYFTVPDVAKHKKIWVDNFGAKPTMVGKTE